MKKIPGAITKIGLGSKRWEACALSIALLGHPIKNNLKDLGPGVPNQNIHNEFFAGQASN